MHERPVVLLDTLYGELDDVAPTRVHRYVVGRDWRLIVCNYDPDPRHQRIDLSPPERREDPATRRPEMNHLLSEREVEVRGAANRILDSPSLRAAVRQQIRSCRFRMENEIPC